MDFVYQGWAVMLLLAARQQFDPKAQMPSPFCQSPLTGHIQFLNIQTQNGLVLHNNARKGASKCGEITPLL